MTSIPWNRINTVLLLLVLIAVIGALASRAFGGPLDPSGPPASTMHSLDDTYATANNVPQSWDRKLDSTNGSLGIPLLPAGCNSDRFQCVFFREINLFTADYDGVLDRETGLVWQRVPSSTTAEWGQADHNCGRADTGGREGWRLPTAAEILSLQDDSVSTGPHLPPGNPFVGAFTTDFWTSTEDLETPASAEAVLLGFGANNLGGNFPMSKTTFILGYWCVRGPTSNR